MSDERHEPIEIEPGTIEARVRHVDHPDAPFRRFGDLARCSECGDLVSLCLSMLGRKECVLPAGHEGRWHISASGSSWPVVGYASDLEAKLRAAEERAERAEAERARLATLLHEWTNAVRRYGPRSAHDGAKTSAPDLRDTSKRSRPG